jgi:hypothetical protein
MDVTPPSVLPDISPTRGESGWRTLVAQNNGIFAQHDFGEVEQRVCYLPLSPLVGEMSGRTEGGMQNSTSPYHPDKTCQHAHYTSPIEP